MSNVSSGAGAVQGTVNFNNYGASLEALASFNAKYDSSGSVQTAYYNNTVTFCLAVCLSVCLSVLLLTDFMVLGDVGRLDLPRLSTLA